MIQNVMHVSCICFINVINHAVLYFYDKCMRGYLTDGWLYKTYIVLETRKIFSSWKLSFLIWCRKQCNHMLVIQLMSANPLAEDQSLKWKFEYAGSNSWIYFHIVLLNKLKNNLLVRKKFYWSWDRGPLLIVRTARPVKLCSDL